MRQLNKWFFLFIYGPAPISHKWEFHFAIFKLIKMPPEGGTVEKEHYKGFWIKKSWYPKTLIIDFPKYK